MFVYCKGVKRKSIDFDAIFELAVELGVTS
jgi:hypothetical protein